MRRPCRSYPLSKKSLAWQAMRRRARVFNLTRISLLCESVPQWMEDRESKRGEKTACCLFSSFFDAIVVVLRLLLLELRRRHRSLSALCPTRTPLSSLSGFKLLQACAVLSALSSCPPLLSFALSLSQHERGRRSARVPSRLWKSSSSSCGPKS